jgi:hypothetical protein
MRAMLCVFRLAVLLPSSVASACLFEAGSLDQVRDLEFNFDVYRDLQIISSFYLVQRFRVDYDVEVNTRQGIDVPRLNMRVREIMDQGLITQTIDEAWELQIVLDTQGQDPPLTGVRITATPPGGVATQRDYHFPVAARPEFSGARQTLGGWFIALFGPVMRFDIFEQPAAVENVLVNGHRYDVLAHYYAWQEEGVPLTAPDCLCHGDFNADGAVDQSELDMVLLDWGPTSRSAGGRMAPRGPRSGQPVCRRRRFCWPGVTDRQ